MLRQTQQQKLQQKQRLTPLQQNLAKLLDTPNLELREVVQREVDDNPALEWDSSISDDDENSENQREITIDDIARRDDAPASNEDNWEPQHYRQELDKNAEHYERPVVSTTSFRDKLRQQLSGFELSESDELIVKYVIDNIDDDGYLRISNQLISSNIMAQFYQMVKPDDVERVIVNVIQRLSPAGICARDLKECLLIQLRQLRLESKNPMIPKAIEVIDNQFDAFTKRKFDIVRKRVNLTEPQFAEVQQIIHRLNPYPGEGDASEVVIPDFTVSNEDGELVLSLNNEYKPRLRVSEQYQKLLESMRAEQDKEALSFVQDSISDAAIFIKSLSERDRTMYLVMKEIMNQQRQFFLTGDRGTLRPMVQRNIAEKVKMDASTVSRVVSTRNVQTEFGVLPLKSLFTEAVDEEGDIASAAVKERLRELVENEDKAHPLSDEKLAEKLRQSGYPISRRTVAKYREQLGILSSSMRKEK